jgi:glycosyltransferase involved in cell wall biosynthesis
MENDLTKVCFFVHSLSGGGAERVVSRLVRHLDRSRFRPLLILIEKKGVFLEDVPPDVPVLDCGRGEGGGRWGWVRAFAGILKSERPEILVSFLWYANAFAVIGRYLSGVPFRLILSERSTVLGSREGWLEEAVRRLSIRLLYRSADRIIANSEALRSQFTGHFGFPPQVVRTLYNPLDIDTIIARSGDRSPAVARRTGRATVVGMGRFTREKGFDVLIRAMSLVRAPAMLLLLGEGKEEANLRTLAEATGISEQVTFLGFRKNPYPILREATVFVLPSRYEGFPNGLAEAMALGIPCIATRCRTGPDELIRDGVDGVLVPVEDPEAMAAAIERLLGDSGLRERLGAAAGAAARRYDAPGIVRQYETLIEGVLR